MVASDTPVFTIVMARPSRSAGTSWAVTASDMAQKPAIDMPSSRRAASMIQNTGAMATSTFDAIANMVSPAITQRRSRRGRPDTMSGPPTMPMTLVGVTS
ncbi:hypothetical protein GCM10023152_29570 [Agromyces bauzanensis]|uniref:Uncharacterized protein n=1 Tax=Agromyces bauzanensis TaxID=1308924 RepID=A0A917PUQ5_9MICO|nr:hypothetical protein [Agromyces bauzanensis]GGJ93253.1 hypothetical protein GCM10011372_34680 [Agromyces bauzanensis]